MTPTEALRQCRATLSLIDRADCKDDAVWQKVVDTQAEVDRVLKESHTERPTLVGSLREYAGNSGYSHGDYADTMLEAASHIERQNKLILGQAEKLRDRVLRDGDKQEPVVEELPGMWEQADISGGETDTRPLTLREYLLREMPSGTVIGDPTWWASRIERVIASSAPAPQPAAAPSGDVERDKLTKALKAARAALKTADYVIKGREHTGFIDTTIKIIDDATKE